MPDFEGEGGSNALLAVLVLTEREDIMNQARIMALRVPIIGVGKRWEKADKTTPLTMEGLAKVLGEA